jgi:hypothetical protein
MKFRDFGILTVGKKNTQLQHVTVIFKIWVIIHATLYVTVFSFKRP